MEPEIKDSFAINFDKDRRNVALVDNIEVFEYETQQKHIPSEAYWFNKCRFLTFCASFGTSNYIFVYILRFAMFFSGGGFLIFFILFTIVLVMPVVYVELFLGKYTQKANCQMYKMMPVFFGLCFTIFLYNGFYQPIRVTQESQFMVNLCRLALRPAFHSSCPKNAPDICYEYKKKGPINDTCKFKNFGMICDEYGELYYPASYHYYRDYKDETSTVYPTWQLFSSVVVSWLIISFIGTRSMSTMESIIKLSLIASFIIHMIIFIMAVTTTGGMDGVSQVITVDTNKINFYEVLMIAALTTVSMGFLYPYGYMTFSAYSHFKIHLSFDSFIIVGGSLLLVIMKLITFFAVSGVVSKAIGVDIASVYVPHRGIYLALVPEFLSYMEASSIFVICYYFIIWFLDIAKLTIAIHMWVINVYEYFMALLQHSSYTWASIMIVLGSISTIVITQFNSIALLPTIDVMYFSHLALIMAALQTTMIFYCYGVSRLSDDIHFFTGSKPMKFWKLSWYLIPVAFSVMAILLEMYGDTTLLETDLPNNEIFTRSKSYAHYILYCLITIMALSSTVFVFIKLGTEKYLTNLLKPDFYWGPLKRELRVDRKNFKPHLAIRSMRLKTTRQIYSESLTTEQSENVDEDQIIQGKIFSDSKFFRNISMSSTVIYKSNKMEFEYTYNDLLE